MHHLYYTIIAIGALLAEHVYHPIDHINNAINLHNKHSDHKNEEYNLNKIEGARQELDCATEASDEQINQVHPAMNNHSGLIYFQLGQIEEQQVPQETTSSASTRFPRLHLSKPKDSYVKLVQPSVLRACGEESLASAPTYSLSPVR